MLRKVIVWGVVIFVVYALVADPAGVAGMVHGAFGGIRVVGIDLARFVRSL